MKAEEKAQKTVKCGDCACVCVVLVLGTGQVTVVVKAQGLTSHGCGGSGTKQVGWLGIITGNKVNIRMIFMFSGRFPKSILSLKLNYSHFHFL